MFLAGDATVQSEMFGPATVPVEVAHRGELLAVLHALHGQFTVSLICDPEHPGTPQRSSRSSSRRSGAC
jgi:NADP-dependent aldehyde dehydrogenase